MKRVLIVDDSSFMRDILKEILIKSGYDVVGEAENGEKAVEKYKELLPDFMTMDISMPKKDGLMALKEIKAFDNNAKIVICSSMNQAYHMDEAKAMGADGFIVKPFVPERIARTFKKLIKDN
jgi:two-component system chemotaxis response regulator CheY